MSVASVFKGAVAQVNPFDNGATYGTYNNGLSAKPASTPAYTSTPSYQPSTTKVDTSAYDKQIADLSAAIKSSQAALAAQPKLPFYNTADAWARAQSSAENIVNPVYTDKLNQYLEKARVKRAQTEQQTATNKQNIQGALTQSLEDATTNRTRTGEDLTNTLGDVSQTEQNFQTNEGTQFDQARAALLGDIANSGLTTSGLGQQKDAQAISERNTASKQQTQEYDKQRRDANLMATRTFEDIGKGEERAKGTAQTKTAQEDVDLKNFIDNASLDETDFRTQNELDRLASVSEQVGNQYKLGVSDFVAGLIGSGARAQDIALAQQVYG